MGRGKQSLGCSIERAENTRKGGWDARRTVDWKYDTTSRVESTRMREALTAEAGSLCTGGRLREAE